MRRCSSPFGGWLISRLGGKKPETADALSNQKIEQSLGSELERPFIHDNQARDLDFVFLQELQSLNHMVVAAFAGGIAAVAVVELCRSVNTYSHLDVVCSEETGPHRCQFRRVGLERVSNLLSRASQTRLHQKGLLIKGDRQQCGLAPVPDEAHAIVLRQCAGNHVRHHRKTHVPAAPASPVMAVRASQCALSRRLDNQRQIGCRRRLPFYRSLPQRMEECFFIGAQKIRCSEVKKAIQGLHGPEQYFTDSAFLAFRQRQRIFAQTLCQTPHVPLTEAASLSRLATHGITNSRQLSVDQVGCQGFYDLGQRSPYDLGHISPYARGQKGPPRTQPLVGKSGL